MQFFGKILVINLLEKNKMKNYINLVVTLLAVSAVACNSVELPEADYDRAIVKNLSAEAGDETVTLSWEDYDNFTPDSFIITWGDNGKAESSEHSYTITDLENGTKYSFSVQAVYNGSKISGETTVDCTPVTSRIAISDLKASAINNGAILEWTKPADNVTSYKVTWFLDGKEAGNADVDATKNSVSITGLTNYKNYSFSIIAKYANGNSDESIVKCMPAAGPLFSVSTSTPGLCASVYYKLDNNITATDVLWHFDDGGTATGPEVSHRYITSGEHTTQLTVTLSDGSEINVDIEISVRDTYFYSEDYTIASGSYNGLKAQCPVFSPDRKTVYVVTFNKPSGLYAFDIATSVKKWSFLSESGGASYGCGPVVDPNSGMICFGNAVSGEFYALNPDGTLKWKNASMKSVNKSYPAIGSDGTVYVLDSGNTIWALNNSDGTAKWSQSLSDAGGNGAILVNESGKSKTGDGAAEIIVGTKNNIYFIKTDGTIKTDETMSSNGMTEITSFAVSPDKKTIYYCASRQNGLFSINLSTHQTANFFDGAITGAAYCPVVGPDGTIFFGIKTSSADPTEAFFAVNPDMTKKWGYTVSCKNAFNYCCPVVDAKGVVYAGINNGDFLALNPDGTLAQSWSYSGGSGFMGGSNICDYAVFSGKIGGKDNNGGLFGNYIGTDRASSWCSRGGDICGSNCLK